MTTPQTKTLPGRRSARSPPHRRVRMPGLDGLALIARPRQGGDTTPVVLLSAFTDRHVIQSALAAGAAGYLSKDIDRDARVAALDHALAGEQSVRVPEPSDAERNPMPTLLGPRDRDALAASQGWSADELAQVTDADPGAVHVYLESARRKLGSDTIGEAVATAAARGLLR